MLETDKQAFPRGGRCMRKIWRRLMVEPKNPFLHLSFSEPPEFALAPAASWRTSPLSGNRIFLTISPFKHSLGNIIGIYPLYRFKGWRKHGDNSIKYAQWSLNRMLVAKWYLMLFARLASLERRLGRNTLFQWKEQTVLLSLIIKACLEEKQEISTWFVRHRLSWILEQRLV